MNSRKKQPTNSEIMARLNEVADQNTRDHKDVAERIERAQDTADAAKEQSSKNATTLAEVKTDVKHLSGDVKTLGDRMWRLLLVIAGVIIAAAMAVVLAQIGWK